MSADLFVLFCVAVLTLLVSFKIWNHHGYKNFPPGPWGLPILGHLIFLGSKPHRTLMAWRKEYGPIIYGRMGSFPCVFLCDPKIIKEAFGMAELAGRGDLDAVIERKERKGIIFNEGLNQIIHRRFALTTLKDFGLGRKGIEGHMQDALGQFLDKVRTKGENGQKAMKSLHISSAYVLSSLYRALMTDELTPVEVENIGNLLHRTSKLGSVISQLAIFLPWIETLVQGVTFGQISLVKERQAGFPRIYRFMEGQIKKRKLTRNKGQPLNVVDAYLDMIDGSSDVDGAFHSSNNSVSCFVGDLVAGGVHTTSVTMEWMFLYMATYPSIQKKVQEEIDLVIGSSRLPALSDRPQMSYMDAAINELLRLSSIAPLGVDHKSIRDVTLRGFQIPKGTLILANLYGVHYDPQVWGEDVKEFKPERWLGEAGKKLKSENLLPFSTGKRKCIGETLARDTLFIFITGVFQRFSVSFEKGFEGPGLEPILGLSSAPVPFKMAFTPRSLD